MSCLQGSSLMVGIVGEMRCKQWQNTRKRALQNIGGKRERKGWLRMAKSIISNERECIVCHMTFRLHKHHIFYGTANRKLSDEYGCWCYLCQRHHNASDKGVHFNKTFDMRLKQECQRKWEETYGTREDFIKVFGKSYL